MDAKKNAAKTARIPTPKNSDFAFLARVEDVHARLALFLTGEIGRTSGTWTGKLTAKQQQVLFGKARFHALTKIRINGETSEIYTVKSLCFGLDSEVVGRASWRELN